MRAFIGVLALTLFGGLWAAPALAAAPAGAPVKKRPSPARLKGMKGALADLERGLLRQMDYNDRPDPPAWGAFLDLLKKECGVTFQPVRRGEVPGEEVDGYNDVMRAEIEHRFGQDVFARLYRRAEGKK